MEDIKRDIEKIENEIKGHDKRVTTIETYFKVVFILALVFGVSGGWGALSLQKMKTSIEEAQKPLDELVIRVDSVSERITELESIRASIDESVGQIVGLLDTKAKESIKTLEGKQKELYRSIDERTTQYSQNLYAFEKDLATLKNIHSNLGQLISEHKTIKKEYDSYLINLRGEISSMKEQAAKAASTKVYITKDKAMLMSIPSAVTGQIVEVVNSDTEISLISKNSEKDWFKVKTSKGNVGWISKLYSEIH